MRILVSGASGLIGSALTRALRTRGDEVVTLVRRQPSEINEISWTPEEALDPNSLCGVDAVIHLAGRNVATLWTDKAKREIFDSRVKGTTALAQAVAESYRKSGTPRVLLSASAIGIYGERGEEILTEQSPRGGGFLADVVAAWERATEAAQTSGVRVVLPRIGVVLSRQGGALGKMLPPFRFGLGGPVGSGKQWMSWIAITDLVRVFLFAMENESMRGVYNAVSPDPVRNSDFARTLGRVLHRPAVMPLPAVVVRTIFGEMGESTLLASERVTPARLQRETEFRFEYPELEIVLQRVLGQVALFMNGWSRP